MYLFMHLEVKMGVTVKELTDLEAGSMGADSWQLWECEVSSFDWEYDTEETFYVLDGRARVDLDDGSSVEFKKGDLVNFPAGVKCRWHVKEKIRKRYTFGRGR